MNHQRFPEEFKVEAAKQLLEHGHSVANVSRRLGVSTHSLYKWIKQQQIPAVLRSLQANQSKELRRLKAALKRVTEERDILKKSGGVLRSSVRLKYAFIAKHHSVYSFLRMCRILDLHPSGYYACDVPPP